MRSREAVLEQDRVVPDAVALRDPLAAADDAEPDRLVDAQGSPRCEAMIEVWIVQIPCAGASASSRMRRASPMPRPRTAGSTYTECSTTPR